jgi:asparagine synthase (glutamine-hydrolysing)
MCGIAGFLNRGQRRLQSTVLNSFSECMFNRGPDDVGFLKYNGKLVEKSRNPNVKEDDFVGFVHRRLSILDLSPSGWQPMSSEDDKIHLILNGEIYNFLELKSELVDLGYSFSSQSDTEVLLAGYLHWGEQVFAKCLGMFAIAILDTVKQELILARDPFGIKPIYYSDSEGLFTFASDCSAVCQEESVSKELNAEMVFRYLRWGTVSYGSQSFFKHISVLQPGSILALKLAGSCSPRISSFYAMPKENSYGKDFEVASKELRQKLLQSVKIHLRSDVPVGIALSGGVDSTSLALLAREIEPNIPLRAYSFVAQQEHINELPLVKSVADTAGLQLHQVKISSQEFPALAEEACSKMRIPMGSTSSLAEYCVYQAARKDGVIVMLSGQGPDELMAGYSRYRPFAVASALFSGKIGRAVRTFFKSIKEPGTGAPMMLGWLLTILFPVKLQVAFRKIAGKEVVPAEISLNWIQKNKGPWETSFPKVRKLQDILRHDCMAGGLQNQLIWSDQASMAHSVEARLPFVLPTISDHVLAMPDEYLVSNEAKCKSILRSAMSGTIPEAILQVRKKIGFESDDQILMRENWEWVDSIFKSKDFQSLPFFDHSALLEGWAKVKEGGPYRDIFWRALNLHLWLRANSVFDKE